MEEKNQIKSRFMSFLEGLQDRVSKKGSPLDARSAYHLTKHGEIKTDEERLEKLYKCTDEIIKNKTHTNDYYCVIQVPEDLVKYTSDIVDHFIKLNYIVRDLTEPLGLNKSYIFLCWNFNPSINENPVSE